MSDSCTAPGVVPRSRAMAGSAGMYMSVAKGETPTMSASGTIGGSTVVVGLGMRSVVTSDTLRVPESIRQGTS
ncbi:hypothetical protein Q9Q99_01920 [Curtobacterium flaccumfaciens]|nr:hypothetical protein Q9Q99_01920 [Curtobacterium flaccumfaciens]